MNQKLTTLEAYKAMFAYLENYYTITRSDEIGAMLGGMSTLHDGGTADPAVWEDWVLAVQSVQASAVDTQMDRNAKEQL